MFCKSGDFDGYVHARGRCAQNDDGLVLETEGVSIAVAVDLGAFEILDAWDCRYIRDGVMTDGNFYYLSFLVL